MYKGSQLAGRTPKIFGKHHRQQKQLLTGEPKVGRTFLACYLLALEVRGKDMSKRIGKTNVGKCNFSFHYTHYYKVIKNM